MNDDKLEMALRHLRTTPHQPANRTAAEKQAMKAAVQAIEELELMSPTPINDKELPIAGGLGSGGD